MPGSKRHHWISQMVLRQFADAQGQVHVVDVVEELPPRRANPRDVFHRNNAHRITGLPVEPDFFEQAHSRVESDASRVIRRWEADQSAVVTSLDRDVMTRFLTLHMLRQPSVMNNARTQTEAELGSLTPEEEQDYMVWAASLPALLDDDWFSIDLNNAERWQQYKEAFCGYEWSLQRFPERSLVLGDRLVSGFGHRFAEPGTWEWSQGHHARAGVGVARRLSVPLSPTLGLLLAYEGRPTSLTADRFNLTSVTSAERTIVQHREFAHSSPNRAAYVAELVQRRRAFERTGLSAR